MNPIWIPCQSLSPSLQQVSLIILPSPSPVPAPREGGRYFDWQLCSRRAYRKCAILSKEHPQKLWMVGNIGFLLFLSNRWAQHFLVSNKPFPSPACDVCSASFKILSYQTTSKCLFGLLFMPITTPCYLRIIALSWVLFIQLRSTSFYIYILYL